MAYRDKHKARLNRQKRNNKFRAIISANKNKPCADCGGKFPPCAMDYDHVRGEKKSDLSKMVNGTSTRLIMEEIAKCDVVCSNCHRIRHWLRKDPTLIQSELF